MNKFVLLFVLLIATFFIGTPLVRSFVAAFSKHNVMTAYAKIILSSGDTCTLQEYHEIRYFLGGPPLEWSGYSQNAGIECFFVPKESVLKTLDTYVDIATAAGWTYNSRKEQFKGCIKDQYSIRDEKYKYEQFNYGMTVSNCELGTYKSNGEMVISLGFVPSNRDQQIFQLYALAIYALTFGVLYALWRASRL